MREKINILLVDDRPENLLTIEAIIEKEEYNLVKASSGEEALKFLLKDKFALILLDVQMPGMDGFTTAKIIKAREKTKHIPILFITANSMENEHIFMGYSVGAIDYILKPIDPLILKSKVDGFVEIYQIRQQLVEQKEEQIGRMKELESLNRQLSTMTKSIQKSEALARVISETSIDSMFILNSTGEILRMNPMAKKMFGYDEAELIGGNILKLFTGEEAKKYIIDLFQTIEFEGNLGDFKKSNEIFATKKDGNSFIAEMQIGLQVVDDSSIVACTIRDISQKKENEKLITHMAYHDYTTDLPNRRAFHQALKNTIHQAREQNQSFGLLFLDMDGFKYVNDSLGHAVGDLVLKEISYKLKSLVREEDLVARVGGDEFNIILQNADRESCLEVAEKIIQVFRESLTVQHYELFVTTSIGLSVFPFDGENTNELVKNADIALYRAKEHGKNHYRVFHSGMNIQSYRAFKMKNDLRKAIVRKELELLYQPRVNLATGEITSAEALLRWNHPNWGTVLPSEFIPLAEDTGQIVEIGEWVIQAVCEKISLWNKKGIIPIRVAINFSTQQLLQKNLVDFLENIFKKTSVSPSQLEIEITESELMQNRESTIHILKQLKNLGITISIDDFGTGYSSLQYLGTSPIDILKIDQSFVQGITNKSNEGRHITRTIITLGKALNLTVIAEGIENEKQLEFLSVNQVDEVQGFLFSPPVTEKEFESIRSHGKYELPYESKKVEKNEEQKQKSSTLIGLQKEYALSSRELEVFEAVLAGLTNKEISGKLFISEHTVKNHIYNIFKKLNVTDRSQAMALVLRTLSE